MTRVDVHLQPTTTVTRRFELLDLVEVTTGEQVVIVHIDARGVRAAAELGASLLASARRQEQGG